MKLYPNLNFHAKQIRLLEIQQGAYPDELLCNLSIAALTERPQYDALSYVWGDGLAKKPIMLDGTPVRVTENLDAAMRHLRRLDKSIFIWIDALCIDQANTPERNHQVSIMGDVYRGAQQVFAWLGELDAETDKVLSMIEIFGSDLMLHWDSAFPHAISEDMVSSSQFVGLCRLLNRPWWTRVWTAQEAILAKRLLFVCGKRRVDAASFFDFTTSFARHMSYCCGQFFLSQQQSMLMGLRYQVDSLYTMQYFRYQKSNTPISTQMSHYRTRSCKDPRDKIYGFIGFSEPPFILVDIQPDYSLSTQSVYEEFAGRIMESSKVLDLLREVFPEQSLQSNPWIKYLPSWVPDWTTNATLDAIRPIFQTRQPHSTLRQYGADHSQVKRNVSTSVSYHKPGKLALQAAIFGVIGALGDPRKESEREVATARFDDVVTIHRWRSLAHIDAKPDRLYFNTNQPNVNKDETVEDAFWEVLCASILLASPDGLSIGGQTQVQGVPEARAAYAEAAKSLGTPMQHSQEQRATQVVSSILESIGSRRFFISSNQHRWMGLAPFTAQDGDQVAVLGGLIVPCIIRRHGDPEKNEWTYVGEAYVHGAMNGEALDLADYENIVLV
ncbi:MAG: hypothetical protein HETSPECPRED_009903 [Heterodermia speciosa]|uniref:Heterokaryon incompatibility domain-containing protein n=1 Tax=Heterodermia speciosa TaxID=116794 RepID=A0A8H3G0N5_9LECA|nr:MAG: hypothetical protein HETSPECPRED_009903 [Heterodermia speciosa]